MVSMGTPVTSNMITALHNLGFDKVFDVDTAADLTIMEEGTELLNRIKEGGKLPLITSCSPGWIKFCEHNFPEFLDNLSTCKSPQQMFGAVLKTVYAERMGIDPAKIFVVSIMPCTAKKFEAKRPEMTSSGYPDIDVVLTTRELARMIKEAGIDFNETTRQHFDDPMGDASGAGVIFGATGGVMEAALRTVAEVITGQPLSSLDFTEVRGVEGIKEATVDVGEMEIKAAVAHGLGNARKLLERVKSGKPNTISLKLWPVPEAAWPEEDSRSSRHKYAVGLISEVSGQMLFTKRINYPSANLMKPTVQRLYDIYFSSPGSPKAHELLHSPITRPGRITPKNNRVKACVREGVHKPLL